MIKVNLEIEDELMEFNIPEGWNEVSVKQSADLTSINREGKSDIEIIIEIISVLSKIETDIIYQMNTEDFNKLIEAVSFTVTPIDSVLAESIMINEEEYFLKKDFSQLTMGELISIETIIKQHEGSLAPAMSQLLCIFLRKKKDNGKLESFKNDFMEREKMFNDVIITDVNNIFLFFLDGNNLSKNSMKDYLEEK